MTAVQPCKTRARKRDHLRTHPYAVGCENSTYCAHVPAKNIPFLAGKGKTLALLYPHVSNISGSRAAPTSPAKIVHIFETRRVPKPKAALCSPHTSRINRGTVRCAVYTIYAHPLLLQPRNGFILRSQRVHKKTP